MISTKLDNTNKIHKCLPEKKGGRVEGGGGLEGEELERGGAEGGDGGGHSQHIIKEDEISVNKKRLTQKVDRPLHAIIMLIT